MSRSHWRFRAVVNREMCQNCGRKDLVQTHHKELRSHNGEDSEENLITLCAERHALVHGRHS